MCLILLFWCKSMFVRFTLFKPAVTFNKSKVVFMRVCYNLILFLFIVSLCSDTTENKRVSYEKKSIKEFGARGDGKTNDQAAFEKAATYFKERKGNGKLIIPKGVYIVGVQDNYSKTQSNAFTGKNVLDLKDCSDFTLEGRGAVIKYADSLKFGAFDPTTGKSFSSSAAVFTEYKFAAFIGYPINLKNCKNIFIRGIEIDGNQKGMILGGKFGDHGFQLPHDGIFIDNCTNVSIDKVNIHHMGRDGIQIVNLTPQGKSTPDQHITITNSVFEYNARQGLSWTGGSGLKVKNSKFNHTGRGRFVSAPAAGVDIEAERGIITNGIFESCEFFDNNACGLVADSGPSSDMQFNNCTFWGTTNWSMWTTKPNYNFYRCNFYGSIVHGYDSPTTKDATKFIRCNFEEKNYKGVPSHGKYLVEVNFVRRILFDSCTFTSYTKKLWWFDGPPNQWTEDERPLMKNAHIIARMTNFKEGDFISVKNCLKESGSTYDLYYPKTKRYSESGGFYIDGGNNKLVWKDSTQKSK